ncbi:hypothetical protein [Hyalangium sp.]|uniref:hypothetical protein n=1 Tax=Hyalangium sp. TaxID=2028555 RepID=UPI002D3227C2|nr:hypothetical protein [Hyalangium sp.]HYI00312.1 hypothetical protein [Hyalangium sp.]
MTDFSLPDIWRLPLRSQKEGGVPHDEQVEHCLTLGLSAVGWGVRKSDALEEVLARVEAEYDRRGRQTVERFANAPMGSLVWTLHTDGTYRIGELVGPWRYDDSSTAERLDCHQVRETRWARAKLLSSEVPGAVVRCFSQRGSSFSRIHDENARAYSHRLFDKLLARPERVPAPTPAEILRSHLDPFDVEDLVFVYLQVKRDFLVLPGSRRTDSAAYEYVLIHRTTHEQAVVQIKTGSSTVDLDRLAKAAGSHHQAFAFSTTGRYAGPASRVELLSSESLLAFMKASPEFLPPRVKGWLTR